MGSLENTAAQADLAAAKQPNTGGQEARSVGSEALVHQLNETLALSHLGPDRSRRPEDAALTLAALNITQPRQEAEPKSLNLGLRQGATEFVSSLGAGVVGTVAFSVAAAYFTHDFKMALTVPLALAAGAVTKYGLKDAGEHLLLDKKDRTLSSKDLLWGGVDAMAGIGASAVEGKVASKVFAGMGRLYLGADIAESTAFDAGKMVAKESVGWSLASNTVRGISGGVAGAGIWSTPHRLAENWQTITEHPYEGVRTAASAIGNDMLKGGVFGGVLGVGGTVVARHLQIMGKTEAYFNPNPNVLRQDIYHINDFHSNTEMLPRMKTLLDSKISQSAARGVDNEFAVTGDVESGRVNFAFTRGGQVENKALVKMGAKTLVPGNHPYDAPGGRFDVPRYPAVMEPIMKDNPDVNLISANLDVSYYPQYQRILKPYTVREAETPWGKVKIGTIGLTTEEGALGEIKFADPLAVTIKTINDLKGQGVSVFNIYSHLGLGEDIKLAKGLIDADVKVAGIIGGHTHDALPVPYWVSSKTQLPNTALSFSALKPHGDYQIPIMQAGHSGHWLGEVNQAITPEGISLRYQTSARLHPITADIPEDPQMRQWLDENLGDINALKNETYNARAVRPYEVANSRNRETPMANLYADALYAGLKKRLADDAPDAVLVHSGGIRSGLPGSVPLTRLDLANVVMNAGDREGEKTELAMMNLTGAQLKNAIEYGVRERIAAPRPSLADQIASLFKHEREELVDEPGNFVQVSDQLKYTYDASRSPLTPEGGGDRIVDLQIKNAAGNFEPVDANKTYKIAARFHPLDKWTKYKMFGDKTIAQVQQELDVKPLPYSQVDLIGEFISGRTLDPSVDSAISGRITDLTPTSNAASLRPGKSLFVAPTISAYEQITSSKDKAGD